ncbi:MAG TPA: magnesium and cobalt transport protein CorA [Croceibacterium sp.]|nr:magnesium and cobalt transport protein CorA [Croceibacterium sp.]
MTIVAARRYRDGKLVDHDLPPDCAAPAKSEFDWIGLVEPSHEEMEQVRAKYGLHPLAVEDALSQRNAPKAEAYGSQLFVIARTAAMGEGDKIAYGQTALFLGEDFLVTVRHGSERAHLALREQLEAVPERLAEGPDFVLHAVLDFIVDGYGPLLDKLELVVGEMEDHAVARFPDQARIRRIFRLRRELRKFDDIAGRMEEVAAKLAETEQPCIDKRARPYFRDVLDNTRRAVTRARWLTDTLTAMVEIAGLLEQSRQGAITRQLAAWAAILAVPTAVAGIYGMNFDYLPELHWRYGYFVVLGVIAAISGGLFVRFRRIGWL